MKTQVSVQAVLEACNQWTDRRYQRIERERAALIEKAMKEDQRSFWQWLFRRPPVYLDRDATRERLIHEVDDFFYNRWDLIDQRGRSRAEKVDQIRIMAMQAGVGFMIELTDDESWLFT